MAGPGAGLTEAEVASRLARGERNTVALRSSRPYSAIFTENLFTTFNLILGAALAVLLVLGAPSDVLFAGGTVLVNILVGIVQEVRAKRALDRLALLSIQQVTVRRDGVEVAVPADQVVRDDLVILRPGDRVPVDGPVAQADSLEMDESLLTGEVDPVGKSPSDEIRSGSFCLAGQGVMRAARIGAESYASQISLTSRAYKKSLTPLQQKLNIVIELLSVGLVIALLLHLIASLNAGLPARDTLRYALVIITNSVPAGLVLSISVSLGLGAVAISRRGTLVQRMNAIESMNSVRVLCTDKTGTLTQNKLRVQAILPLDGTDAATLRQLVSTYAALVATPNTSAKALYEYTGPPAMVAEKQGEVPFSSVRKWGAILAGTERSGITILVGAPDILLAHEPVALEMAQGYGQQGLRVLAVVTSDQPITKGGHSSSDIRLPEDRQSRGLILLGDELRPDIGQTITALRREGVAIKVISGDSTETVAAIARQAGIPVPEHAVFSQHDLDRLEPAAFDRAAIQGVVFGRISPDTKYRLITGLMRQGEYVAMIGDGVNDVPALKAAQLAIAMHDGAQIAQDVADMVLLNNAFSTLPEAFVAGATIKQKILVAARLYLTKNIMVILAILLIGFTHLPFPINPAQLSMVALATISVPTTLFAFGLLRPQRMTHFLRNVLGYSLVAGGIGALTLTLTYILVFFASGLQLPEPIDPGTLTRQDYEVLRIGQAQTSLTLVALFYGLLVWWESARISIWRPATLRQHPWATIAGGVATIAAVFSLFASPGLFHIQPLSQAEWSAVLFLPVLAHYILRALIGNPRLRAIPDELSRP